MLSQHTKVALASAWIMTAGLIGALGNMTSIAAGALVLGCGLVPPLLAFFDYTRQCNTFLSTAALRRM